MVHFFLSKGGKISLFYVDLFTQMIPSVSNMVVNILHF